MMKSTFLSVAICLLIATSIFTSCLQSSPWAAEAKALLEKAADLEQQHKVLDARTDSLWDATSAALDKGMPADFPPIDRNIFLKARNADHIRMFMSYQSLSPQLQSMVDKAGEYDKMIAQQIRDLQVSQQVFEQQKNTFLQKVAQQDKATSIAYAGQFRTASASLHQ